MRLGVNGHITHDTSHSGYGEKDNYILRFKIVDAIRLREMGLRLLHAEKSRRLNALELGTGKFTEKHRRFEKIVSIVPLGTRKLIDITLAPNHDFIANGIVTHNCDGSLGTGHAWDVPASPHASTSTRAAHSAIEYPVLPYPADWKNEESPTYNRTLGYDKVAGYRRNTAMANDGDALVALWDGKSKGTMHMVNEIEKRGKPCRRKIL